MILEVVEVENYRSYRKSTLDLRGVTAGVFFGETGSGKSSIMESFLWACYGKPEGRGHIALGADRCRVSWIFRTLAGLRYRVVRSQRVSGENVKTDLQFTLEQPDGAWKPLGGKKIAETEAAIAGAVGLDYDTLISSALSPQGMSSRFTKPPKVLIDGKYYEGRQARMQIFMQGEKLGHWEEKRKTATKEADRVEQGASTLEAQVVEADCVLATRSDQEGTLVQAEIVIGESRGMQEILTTQNEEAGQQIARLEAEIPRAQRDLAAFADDRSALSTRERAVSEKRNRVERYQGILDRREDIESEAMQAGWLDTQLATLGMSLAATEAQGRALASQKTEAMDLVTKCFRNEALATGKLNVASEKVALKDQLGADVVALTEAREQRGLIVLEINDIDAKVTEQRATKDALMVSNAKAQEERGKVLAEEKKVGAQKAGIEPQIAGHEKRTAVMDTVPCLNVGNFPDTCPLLKDARESIGVLDDLLQERANLCAWKRPELPEISSTLEIDRILSGLSTQRTHKQAELSICDKTIQRLAQSEIDLASLATVSEQIPSLETDLEAAKQSHQDATQTLRSLQERLESCKATYLATKGEITQGQTKRQGLQASVDLLPEIGHAESELPGLRDEITALEGEMQALRGKLAQEPELAAGLKAAVQEVEELRDSLRAGRQLLTEERGIEQKAIEAAATARKDLERLTDLDAERGKAAQEADTLRKRHTLLKALSDFYRQAPYMILETAAIPEVEQEANRILARISKNGMRTSLKTQREQKNTEALVDGLDIVIQDRRGERKYEDFSGGQKSQIDIAYRVGLAKRAARMSAAGIGCLFLDEGLETQDKGCIGQVREALQEIQGEFPQLFVITHIDELRDTFSTVIQVSGGPDDSRAELVTA